MSCQPSVCERFAALDPLECVASVFCHVAGGRVQRGVGELNTVQVEFIEDPRTQRAQGSGCHSMTTRRREHPVRHFRESFLQAQPAQADLAEQAGWVDDSPTASALLIPPTRP